jgi:hypothetical protein
VEVRLPQFDIRNVCWDFASEYLGRSLRSFVLERNMIGGEMWGWNFDFPAVFGERLVELEFWRRNFCETTA